MSIQLESCRIYIYEYNQALRAFGDLLFNATQETKQTTNAKPSHEYLGWFYFLTACTRMYGWCVNIWHGLTKLIHLHTLTYPYASIHAITQIH